MGVSVFTDYLIDAFSSTRVGFSTAYMIGTLASALLIPSAGKLFDRFGARITASIAAVMLALFLLLLSSSGKLTIMISSFLSFPAQYVGFSLAVLAFFGIRFFGQGVLTLVSRAMVVKWFDSRRGTVVGLMGLVTAFGFSYAPRPLQYLIDIFGWDRALAVIGGILLLGFFPFVLLIFRTSPESCGMVPEQGLKKRAVQNRAYQDSLNSSTAEEARKDLRYWVLILLLWFWGLYNTAFTFHVISIFSETGRTAEEALRIFLPIGIISVIARFSGSWLSDRIDLKYLILALTGFIILAGGALFQLTVPGARIVLVISMGAAGGLFGMLNIVSWPKLFGIKHLGAISGFAMGFIVAGSALGPWFFSLVYHVTGGYRFAGLAAMVTGILITIIILPISFSHPEEISDVPAVKPVRESA